MDMRNEANHLARQDIARQAAAQKASAEFLTFRLGGEEYGIDILRVQEIRSYEEPTRIANSPAFIKGVVNLRGVIVPVVDLRIKLGCDKVEYNGFTVVIVLNVHGRVVGAVVDSVSDVLELAGELNCALDLHTDEHTDSNRLSLEDLADRVITSGLKQAVVASHCVSLGMQTETVQKRVSERVAEAEISVIALPHTNLFLQGRDFATATPRGLTAVSNLRKAGVKVAFGADNLQDPFNPIGRGDPLESAGLAILTAHLLPSDAFDSVSTVARQVMGLEVAGPQVGATANLMLTQASSTREAIANTPTRNLVLYKGKLTHSRLAAVN